MTEATYIDCGDSIMMRVEGEHSRHEITRAEAGRMVYRNVEWEMSDAYWIEHAVKIAQPADQGGQEP